MDNGLSSVLDLAKGARGARQSAEFRVDLVPLRNPHKTPWFLTVEEGSWPEILFLAYAHPLHDCLLWPYSTQSLS